MSYRLFHLLLLSVFCIIGSYEMDIQLNLNKNSKLLCYSCQGSECETVANNSENIIVCNKQIQLCWVGMFSK